MDKVTKKRVKKYIIWGALAAVVALLAAMPLLARQEAEADGPVASVLSAEVTRGTISSALHGGGNIVAETVEEVKLPGGVKITEFLVKNGQIVAEGAPLATVDKVSVMTAITEVNETLEYLQEQLEDARDEKVSSSIKATAGGRVKKIFAQSGESVQDVMLRDGALAVLSLDGLMAVKLELPLAVSTGEAVAVTLADGTEVSGRVESNLDGVVIITVEDQGYEAGQRVTVTRDGTVLGESTLYIHNAWKATAYSGTIENVSAKEEKTLSAGAALFTVTDRDYEGELRHRANQHREYEALLQELLQMYHSGILTAPCAGEVEGVDQESAYLLSAAPEGWRLAPLDNTASEGEEKGWTVMLLGATTGCDENCILTKQQHVEAGRNLAECPALCTDTNCHINPKVGETHTADCITRCLHSDTVEGCPKGGYHCQDCIRSCVSADAGGNCTATKHKQDCIEYCKEADGVKRFCDGTKHKETCIGSCTKAADASCPSKLYHYAECLKKCNSTTDCPGNIHYQNCPHKDLLYTARMGLVVRVVNGVVEFTYESAESVEVKKMGSGYTIPGKPNPTTMIHGPDFVPSNGVSCKKGDIILIITGTKGDQVVVSDLVYVCGNVGSGSSGMDMSALAEMMKKGMGGFDLSALIGGFGGLGNYGAAAPEAEPLFDLEGNTLLTLTPHETATLLIAIDEHDIAKAQLGMEATVKVEALKNQEFPARITDIAIAGTNNGGSSKFAVELTLPMSEEMLSGMSASAVIPLEKKTDTLLIPAAALVQQGAKTVVYTALDDEGQPAAPVEVETGLTDGEYVEVVSNLTEGQKIYYLFYDTVELDTSAEAERYTIY